MIIIEQLDKLANKYSLSRKDYKDGRVSYRFKNKVIISEYYPVTGNGYVWGKEIQSYRNKYEVDPRG